MSKFFKIEWCETTQILFHGLISIVHYSKDSFESKGMSLDMIHGLNSTKRGGGQNKTMKTGTE